jgi:hypothetical protein
MRKRRRPLCTPAAVMTMLVILGSVAAAGTAGATGRSTSSVTLPADLEAIRAAEATRLYGDPAERPMNDRNHLPRRQ